MSGRLQRAYVAAGALLALFLLWAGVAARPWSVSTPSADPAIARLAAREAALRQREVTVRRLLDRRWGRYRVRLAARRREIDTIAAQRAVRARAQRPWASLGSASAAPPVRVISLPPVTVTRTS